jgi:hypothetical protein
MLFGRAFFDILNRHSRDFVGHSIVVDGIVVDIPLVRKEITKLAGDDLGDFGGREPVVVDYVLNMRVKDGLGELDVVSHELGDRVVGGNFEYFKEAVSR